MIERPALPLWLESFVQSLIVRRMGRPASDGRISVSYPVRLSDWRTSFLVIAGDCMDIVKLRYNIKEKHYTMLDPWTLLGNIVLHLPDWGGSSTKVLHRHYPDPGHCTVSKSLTRLGVTVVSSRSSR